ncbi:hypothetical protein IWW47_002450, partial [Coemansia sp. RSA 2052]
RARRRVAAERCVAGAAVGAALGRAARAGAARHRRRRRARAGAGVPGAGAAGDAQPGLRRPAPVGRRPGRAAGRPAAPGARGHRAAPRRRLAGLRRGGRRAVPPAGLCRRRRRRALRRPPAARRQEPAQCLRSAPAQPALAVHPRRVVHGAGARRAGAPAAGAAVSVRDAAQLAHYYPSAERAAPAPPPAPPGPARRRGHAGRPAVAVRLAGRALPGPARVLHQPRPLPPPDRGRAARPGARRLLHAPELASAADDVQL